jgi:hypothetical protein
MTISLTCACGALLEIDDKFAGQTISCPDCQRKLQAPTRDETGRPTSGFALASLICALVGAFTVVGTLLAIALGAYALWDIKRRPDQVAGRGFALGGVIAGVVLTALTLFAYTRVEVFGLDSIARQTALAGKVEYPTDLEITNDRGFTVTRPSAQWGRLRDDPLTSQPLGDNLVLVNIREDAHVLCQWLVSDGLQDMERCKELAVEKFRESNLLQILDRRRGKPEAEVRSDKDLPPEDNVEMAELLLDTKPGNRPRAFLMRVLKRKGDLNVYFVAAGARKARFERLEPQLRKAVESFKLKP